MKIKILYLSCFTCCSLLLLSCSNPQLAAFSVEGNKLNQITTDKHTITTQEAVEVVFQEAKKQPELSELMKSFSRVIGIRKGSINVGGPPPGVKVAALFETVAFSVGQGSYEVQFIRRWKERITTDGVPEPVFGDVSNCLGNSSCSDNLPTLSTTWNFRVEADRSIRYLGRSGCDPFQYKSPQKNHCDLPK